MKKGSVLVALFGVWCFGCAMWYMFGLKGASTEPAVFSPQPMLVAIVEVLVMLLGAFLIGFGSAWLFREPAFQDLQGSLIETKEALADAKTAIERNEREIAELQNDAETAAKRLEQAEEKVLSLLQDNANRMKEVEREVKKLSELEKKFVDQEAKLKTLDGEASSARFRVRLLENDLAEKESAINQLSADIDQLGSKPPVEHRDWSDHPFVRPPQEEENEVDDLTEIKGIGPAFERKLNALDIFSYRQISEMSGDAVQRLAEAIEVFPDRIHRDNWVGQATRLYQLKVDGGGE